jgi:uncharacterized protein
MSRDKKIDYIEFKSSDIPATKVFYSHVFGWQFVDYGPDYTSFSDNRIAGGFEKGYVTTGAGPLVVIFVDDLQSTLNSVLLHGGTITKEIFSFPGGSRFQFMDPSGNELAAWLETSE